MTRLTDRELDRFVALARPSAAESARRERAESERQARLEIARMKRLLRKGRARERSKP
jgi:hypothetical protein